MKINEKSEFTLDLKTIIMVVGFATSLSAMYFTLKAEVELAKTLPKSEISRSEMDLKMELISKTVLSNAEKLGKMESAVEKIEERVYELK